MTAVENDPQMLVRRSNNVAGLNSEINVKLLSLTIFTFNLRLNQRLTLG